MAKPVDNAAEEVVLPTPPLPEVITIMFAKRTPLILNSLSENATALFQCDSSAMFLVLSVGH
jgi:hypothetical protein